MKVHVRKRAGHWTVTCDGCEVADLFSFLPWAVTVDHATALTLALWHARTHREQACGRCHRFEPLPRLRPVAGEPSLFHMGRELYALRPGEVLLVRCEGRVR